jgi:hypothetical protein
MFQTKVVEEIKTHFILNNSPRPKNCSVYEMTVENVCGARQATDDSKAHASSILDT